MSADAAAVKSIFGKAVEIQSPAERAAYLAGACGGDARLRGEVESLLRAAQEAQSFFQGLGPSGDVTVDPPVAERPGTVIGPYKLMEEVGEGGMGLVFVAEQQQPIRRKVALKVIKPGMDTRQVIARFEAERQALALMDHPNIARVLDGGQTPWGRPYFVMELVKGVPITDYCDQNRVPVRGRLELFVHVCAAVQHAHQKAIIHRDLKPSNVLVASPDGTPVPKVIDFGVAKAVGQQLTDKTVHTHFAQLIGTPLYMSPEQAGMSGLDVDTRSDVYSLGVLLYELLTGTTPFDKERLREADFDEIRRIVREEEPPPPSTRLSTLGHATATVSANRQSDPKRLCRLVRGELDWVVMRALEKDRNRRYESAGAFAADVRRYLNDEPVLACPPSAWYRCRKFARRNKAALAVTGLILFFLVLLGAAAWWYQQEQAARAVARAGRQRETERAVTEALVQAETLLAEGDGQMNRPGRWLATARLAEKAAERAEGLAATGGVTGELAERVRRVREAVDAALAESGLLVELDRIRLERAAGGKGTHFFSPRGATLYREALRGYGVDLATPAEAAARVRASRLCEALVDALEDWAADSDDAAVRARLAKVLNAAGPAPGAFSRRWREAAARRDGPALLRLANDPATESLTPTEVVKLARVLARVNEGAVARRLLRSGRERYPGDFWLNHTLGIMLLDQPQQAEEAVRYLTAAVALRSDSAPVRHGLGRALAVKGDLKGAIREYRAALDIDPKLAEVHNSLGVALAGARDLEEAIREYRAALRIDPEYAPPHYNLGNALKAKGDRKGAIREYREAIRIDASYAPAHHNLAYNLYLERDLEGAIREYRAEIAIDRRNAKAHYDLGIALAETRDREGAVREYREALRIDPHFAHAHINLGKALADTGDVRGAIREYRAAIGIDPKDADAHIGLGNALLATNDREGAIRAFRDAVAAAPDNATAHGNLGVALTAKGDFEGATREFRAATRIDPKDANLHIGLGNALLARKDLEGAVRAFRDAVRVAPQDAKGHVNLASALGAKGDLEGAAGESQTAIRIDPECAEAYCNLGQALLRQGRFVEALRALKTAHRLGSRRADWRYPSAALTREAEQLIKLDAGLPKILGREVAPASAAEGARLGWLCQQPYKQLYAAAARLYGEAFTAEPKLAEDLRTRHRYNAACAAALAGCGRGKDAAKLDGRERARLRRQALAWLRADLAGWREHLKADEDGFRPVVRQVMPYWLADSDLAVVRDPEALDKLPEAERKDWRKLWADVRELLTRAGKSPGQEK